MQPRHNPKPPTKDPGLSRLFLVLGKEEGACFFWLLLLCLCLLYTSMGGSSHDNGQEELKNKNKSCVNDVTLRARQAFRASVAFLLLSFIRIDVFYLI